MTAHQRNTLRVVGGLGLLLVMGTAWAIATGRFGDDPPTLSEQTQSAEFACRHSIEERVAPLDVKHRDPGSSASEYVGETFTVRDRAAVEGDLVNYECTTTRQDDGDWSLDSIELR